VRAFVAVELDDQVRREVAKVQQEAASRIEDGIVRWARPANLHLTLAFLGEVAEQRQSELEAHILRACGGPPFDLRLGETGAFPNLARPRIFWIGVTDGVASLANLAEDLRSRLRSAGFSLEERAFHPHLTLGRLNRAALPAEALAAGEIWVQAGGAAGGELRVKEVALIRSQLGREGPTYSALRRFPLGGAS
jgi:2'-5' RNA ligase